MGHTLEKGSSILLPTYLYNSSSFKKEIKTPHRKGTETNPPA